MILLIDSYDSFSYNLYQLVGALNPDIQVIRNDEKTVAEIRAVVDQCSEAELEGTSSESRPRTMYMKVV